MKKLLLFLLGLLPLVAQAQLINNPRAQIRDSVSLSVLYEVTTDVPKGTYSADESGYLNFNLDVKAGKWNLTLSNGAVIPKGTRPTKVIPVPTAPAAPDWARLRYSLPATGLLFVEGGGTGLAKLRFQRVDGTKITGTNPNGVNLTDSDFYSFGPNDDATWPMQWRASFTPAIAGQNFRITAQKSDGTLFVKEFVPASGADKTVLYNATGSTSTPPSSTTTTPPTTTPTTTVAYNQSFESEAAQFSNSGQDVFAFEDAGSSGSRITCCFTDATRYLDYSVTGIPGAGTLSLEFQYQTNTGDPAEGTVSVNGSSQSISLAGLGGGKATKTVSIPVIAGTNTVRIAGKSGTFLQDKIRVYGSITTGGSSGGGSTSPGTGNQTVAYTSFTRGVIVGNSITTHTASTAQNWNNNNGMAASAPGKDYAHIIESALQGANPSFTLAKMGQGSGLELSYNSTDQQAVTNTLTNLNYDLGQLNGTSATYDLIIVSIGENTANSGFDETKFRSMLDQLFASIKTNGPPTVVFRNSFWSGNESANAVLQSYASAKGYKFVNLDNIRERADYKASQYADAGVAHHPNDAGHAAIAGLFLDQLKTTSSGGGSSTPAPNTYAFTNPNTDYVAVQDQGWLNQDQKFFDNGTVKIGILDAGGVIATARLMSNDRGLINTFKTGYNDDPNDPRYNTITYDLGRSWMPASDYFSPDPDVGYAFKTKNADGSFKNTKTGYKGNVFNTGGNTVQGGSLWPALTKSPILASAQYTHPTRGREVYIKTRPAIWGVKGELGNIIVEEWINFPRANVVHVYTRHTVIDRDPAQVDEQRLFRAREQENPCIYTIANLTQHLINLPGQGRKNIWPGNQNNPSFSSTYHTSDCKIGAYEGDGGTGLTLYSPMNSAFKSGHFGATQGGEYDSQASYINGASRMNYDNTGIYDDENFVVVGTESDANAAIPQLPGIDQSFSFDFGKENMRWWNVDSRLIRESGNNWTWYLDSKVDNGQTSFQCKFQSPWRAWTASNITSISFEMAVTNASQLDMIWEQPGPDNQPNYTKRFSVTGDGQFRTYTVSTSDPNWNGIITNVGLRVVNGAVSNGAKVIIRRIYKN